MTTPCPKCDREHDPTHCQGHVIKDPVTREPIPPRQCEKTPVKGATVCRSHGAAKGTPAAAKAEDRQVEAVATETVRKLWAGLGAGGPRVTDPVDLLERMAGALEQMADVLGERINELTHIEAGADLSRVRGQVMLFMKVVERLEMTASKMEALGIAERHVRTDEGIAGVVVAAAHAGLAALPGLLPGDRSLFVEVFLRELDVENTVVGEVTG